MHKFLRAIGFSKYQKKRDVEKLLEELLEDKVGIKRIQSEEDTNSCEIKAQIAPNIGISIFGEMDQNGVFQQEYHYPYLYSQEKTSDAECTIQRHTEKETYAGLLDEFRVGISLIFYIQNAMEYEERLLNHSSVMVESVNLSGLSVSGKILLPVQKTEKQKAKARVASKDRNSLIEAAKNGDEDAMETLTIEDIDMYSQISRRMLKEDIYTIIDSFFMPCGVECDQYSLIGEIMAMEVIKNQITGEEVYDLSLDCNDMVLHVGINKMDLLGVPAVGRRFKGQIWMQGHLNFENK